MVEDYQGSLDLIFAYGYGCYTFKNNITGDQPDIPNGMLDSSNPLYVEFFDNSRCPPALAADKAIDAEVIQAGAAKGLLLRNRPPPPPPPPLFFFLYVSLGYVWKTLQVAPLWPTHKLYL